MANGEWEGMNYLRVGGGGRGEGCYDSYSIYLNLSVISIAPWFPHTLFPVGLWYYTCLTCFGAFSFLSFVSFSSLISDNAWLFFLSHRSRFTFYSHISWRSTLPRRPFSPSVSSWTQHYFGSFITNFSLSAVLSLDSLTPGTPGLPGIPLDPGMPGKPTIDSWK